MKRVHPPLSVTVHNFLQLCRFGVPIDLRTCLNSLLDWSKWDALDCSSSELVVFLVEIRLTSEGG